jgi:hypothetical protein
LNGVAENLVISSDFMDEIKRRVVLEIWLSGATRASITMTKYRWRGAASVHDSTHGSSTQALEATEHKNDKGEAVHCRELTRKKVTRSEAHENVRNTLACSSSKLHGSGNRSQRQLDAGNHLNKRARQNVHHCTENLKDNVVRA